MTAAEDTRNLAEAAKFNAEAEVAKRLAALHDANVVRAEEEARKFQQEGHKAEVEALNLELQNRLVRIAADAATREEEDHLATDRYHHIYTFNGAVNDSSVRQCMTMLTNWMRKNAGCDIEIVFNSPGGSLVDGMALYDFIQLIRSKGHKVTTSTLGMAASMAGILLQAGDVRVMGSQSWLMIHEASFGAGGKIGEVEDVVEWVKMVQERILDIFAARSTMTKPQIRSKWKRKDWWLDSDAALAAGFIDEIR